MLHKLGRARRENVASDILCFVKKEGESKEQSIATDNQLTTWTFPESGAVLTDR
jgi:hypothetical protein